MNKIEHIEEIVSITRKYSKDTILNAIYSLQESVERKSTREYLKMRYATEEYLQMDVMDGKYKGKSEKDYEEQRVAVLKKLETMEDPLKQIELIINTANEIDEGIKFLEYNYAHKKCCEIPFKIETCKNMAEAGATMTEIVKYVPRITMGDAYHLLRDYLDIEVEITEEERAQIEEYDKTHPPKRPL